MTTQSIEVNRDIRERQRAAAEQFRQTRAAEGTLIVRLLSSPGSGKTSLLERTANALTDEYRVAVLVGDLETDRDAERLKPFCPTRQITTGGACHLEIPLVERAFEQLQLETPVHFLFIEDVGNLICPASHDLGEHVRVVLLSVTEGDDKPGKYPKMFRGSDVLVISKIDLLPYVPFSIEAAHEDAKKLQPQMPLLPICARTGEGMKAWLDFLIESRASRFSGAKSPQSK